MKSKSVLVMLDPLSLPRLEGILAYAHERQWAVILEDRLPEGGLDRIDGALVSLRGRKDQRDRVKILQKLGRPVVDLTVACPEIGLPRVVSDHEALGTLAAQHFLERGFEHFAWYSSTWSHVHALRFKGYARVLGNRGIVKFSPDRPLDIPPDIRPLAVLAYDESDAARIIRELHVLNLDVPNDVAVLGIGNDPFLCENGDLTISSVDQNLVHAAYEACVLLDRLMGSSSPGPRRSESKKVRRKPTVSLIPPVGVIPRASTDTLAHPNPTIRAALVFINQNLHRAFGAAEVAGSLGCPRSTLDHLFLGRLGHSIGREILNQRIQLAKRLLLDRSMSIHVVADACGFCNASYFTNVFRRETGLSPKKWTSRRL